MCRCRSHCLLTDCAKLPCLIGGCHQWYQVLPPGRVPGGVASARRAVFPCAPVVDRSCTHKVVVPCYRDMLPCRQQQDAVLSRHSLTERGQSTLLNSRVSLLSTTRELQYLPAKLHYLAVDGKRQCYLVNVCTRPQHLATDGGPSASPYGRQALPLLTRGLILSRGSSTSWCCLVAPPLTTRGRTASPPTMQGYNTLSVALPPVQG